MTAGGLVVSSMPWLHFTPRKDPVPTLQEAGWAPGPVWTGGKSRPQQDLIPDHPACSQLLYQLSYPAHALCSTKKQSDELSNTSSRSGSSSDVYILSSGSLLRYSKSDFGGIHFQRTSLILCASFKNMRLFIQ
jgi:hypothetical protein